MTVKPIAAAYSYPSSEIARAMARQAAHDEALTNLAMYGEDASMRLPGLFAPVAAKPPALASAPEWLTPPLTWLDGRAARKTEEHPGGAALKADGWKMIVTIWDPVTPRDPKPHRAKIVGAEWHRYDGGRLDHDRVRWGHWADRLPTNRKRKRERCKARRRARRAAR